MKIYLNNPIIKHIECSVDEFEKIKEILDNITYINNTVYIPYSLTTTETTPIKPYYKYNITC